MSHPFPDRPPGQVAGAFAALAAVGACCGHSYAGHAPDGCRLCQIQHRTPGTGLCPGWRAADPRNDPGPPTTEDPVDAEVESSGDPLTDAIHDVLARHYRPDAAGVWISCRDELIAAARRWATTHGVQAG